MYLYKIVVRKPQTDSLTLPLSDAIDIVRPFLCKNMKQVHYNETKNQYTFINIKRKHFMSKTFDIRSNGRITIYLGELKQPQFKKHHKMRGEGLMSYIYSGNWVNDYSTKAKKVLHEYGNQHIQSITIYRTPIQKMIDYSLNLFSLGKWKQLKQKYGYDTFFHLALVINVGVKNIIIEKNEIINISTEYKTTSQTETMNVNLPVGVTLTINELLEKTKEAMGNREYFSYDAFNNNCQSYIRKILQENGLYNININKFLYQDMTQFKKDIPSFLHTVANALTTSASVFGDAVN
jgi:hypothetical protein